MSNRIQALRTSTPATVPAAGTRLPGELWVNFPDLQLGVMDAAKTPQKLIAVRYFSSSTSYVAGDAVAEGGALYIANGTVPAGPWNATQWTKLATATDLASLAGGASVGTTPPASPTNGALWFDANSGQLFVWFNDGTSSQWVVATNQNLGGYLLTSGGVITGGLTVNGAMTITSGSINGTTIGASTPAAATVTSLNSGQLAGMRNLIINGDMRIDQRWSGSAALFGVGSAYIADRWSGQAAQANKLTVQRVTSTTPGSAYALLSSATAAATPAAADNFSIFQPIEGLNIAHLGWGRAGALPITISGIITASIAGNYAVSIRNTAVARSYVALVNVPTPAVDTVFAVTVPGDTTGTWVTDNTGGMYLTFDLGSGSNFNAAAANAWSTGNFIRTAASVSMIATLNASVRIKDIQVELGTVATPFERRNITVEMQLCQRYFWNAGNLFNLAYNNSGSTQAQAATIPFPVSMRIAPTASYATAANLGINTTSFTVVYQTIAYGGWVATNLSTFSAEL